jgi:cytochrome c553
MIRCLLLIALFQPAFAQQLPADWPHWAYGYLGQPTADEMAVVPPCPENAVPRSCGPTGTPLEDDGIKLSLPGTSASFTRVEANYSWGPADWYPGDHPPMPEIVATGRRDAGIRPCALCHFPNGQGKIENGHVTGLPVGYFLAQLEAFAAGDRYSADPRKANTNEMARIARALTDAEKRQAAEYFGSIRFRSMVRVVEADEAPQVRFSLNRLVMPIHDAADVTLGQRIVEVPEHPELTEVQRNPRGTFVAYVPIGSVAKGEKLVAGNGNPAIACRTCHGPVFRGIADIPPIGGRTTSYLMRQLWDMKQGTRKNPLMDPVLENLSAEDLLNIVAYLATQTP